MLEIMILIAQTVCVLFLAAWLTTGVLENMLHSELNSAFTAEVLDMARIREEYPEAFKAVAYRRISTPSIQRALFRLIVFWEVIAVIALWVGVFAMQMVLFGYAEASTGRAFAVLGTLLFTSIWAGFLIGGNWFCYWFCHEEAQNTHYQMTLWGIATLVLLAVG